MSEPITLGIVGTGLIGGSIGLRSRELGWQTIGFDVNPGATEEAKIRGAIDEAVAREILYERADTVVIATPLRAAIAEIEAIGVHKPRATLIVDVASVKEPVAQAARGLGNFVATHPLAGSERSGAAAAHAKLFTGKAWVYVPPGDQALETRVLDFIAAMGARAVPADAATHDAILALTSHVPQLLATLFGKTLRQQKIAEIESFCGPVAMELLRLGDSNVEMWREIFAYNNNNIAKQARELAARLNAAAQALVHETGREKD